MSQTDLEKVKMLYESVMSKASHGLFYREGNTLGKEIADMASGDKDNFIETASRLIKGRGWVEDITFNGDTIIAKGSIEASESSEPTCHRLRGMIHAIAERVTDRKLICIEEMCISKGDPYCQFALRDMEGATNDRSEEVDK